jgi:circadian clock protein KaiC
MRRIKTGIKGFDKLIQGGLPEGSSNLICGAPGTGKTILSLEYLYRGAMQFKENGVYVTMEEKPNNLKNQALQFGWDFNKLENKKKILFVKIPIDTVNVDIVKPIEDAVKKIKAKRLVIDSLSILAINAAMYKIPINTPREMGFVSDKLIPSPLTEETKQFIYIFVSKLNDLNTTSLYVGDSPEGGKYLTRDTVSEFVCDGVIKLDVKEFGKTIMRTLEIKKMRKTLAEPGLNTLRFSKKGIVISEFNY